MNVNEKVALMEEELKKLRHKVDVHATEQMEIMATFASALRDHKECIIRLDESIKFLNGNQGRLIHSTEGLLEMNHSNTKAIGEAVQLIKVNSDNITTLIKVLAKT